MEARYYQKLENKKVKCFLCRHNCIISEGHTGICAVRKNIDGTLVALTYQRCIAKNVDPIEKKPLFHVLPGTSSYSIATVGCNFKCSHCQNFEISQLPRDEDIILGEVYPPEDVVNDAFYYHCKSISYTYTEPTIYFEYAFDTSVLAKKRGLKNIFVTNGYTGEEALTDIAPYLDAANVDLKAFTEEFYKKICGATLRGVLETLKLYKKLGIWIEITTLIIPGYNDREEELRDIAKFIKSELGDYVPWHVTAFYPTYKLTDAPRTPVSKLKNAWEIGKEEGLKFVYTGNIFDSDGESTYCPKCNKKIVERASFKIKNMAIKDGKCSHCNEMIPGIWN